MAANIGLLYGEYFVVSAFLVTLGMVLPQMMKAFHLSEVHAGWLVTLSSFSFILAAAFTPFLTMQMGFSAEYLLGSTIFSVSMLGFAFANSYGELAILFIMSGAGQALLMVALFSYVGKVSPLSTGKFFGTGEVGFYTAALASVTATSYLLNIGESWHAPMTMLGLVSVLLMLANSAARTIREQGRSMFGPNYGILVRRNSLLILAAMMSGNSAWMILLIWGPSYVVAVGTGEHLIIGIVMQQFLLFAAMASFCLGWLTDRIGRRREILLALLVTSASLSFSMLFPNIFQRDLVLVLMGFTLGPYYIFILGLAQRSVRENDVHTITAISMLSVGVSGMLGPLLVAELAEFVGLPVSMSVALGILIISCGVAIYLLRSSD